MPELTLFYKPTCPYCQKVLGFMEENDVSLPLKDIDGQAAHREELVKIGGKGQIPCLIVDGKPLYESDDIIRWLKDNPQK